VKIDLGRELILLKNLEKLLPQDRTLALDRWYVCYSTTKTQGDQMNKIEFSAIKAGDKIMIGKAWGDKKSYPVKALEAPTTYQAMGLDLGLNRRLKIVNDEGKIGYVYGKSINDLRPLA
jgi:hypothetical protein